MSDLKTVLFEDPSGLYWLLALAAAVTGVVLYYRRTRGAVVALAVPVVLGAAVAVVSSAVTTERERLAGAVEAMVEAIAASDVAAVDAWVDDDYSDGVFTKANLPQSAAEVVKAMKVRAIRLFEVEVTVDDRQAEVDFRAMVHLTDSAIGRDVIPTRWRFWWTRRPDRWKLTSARLVEPEVPRAPKGP